MKKYLSLAAVLGAIAFLSVSYIAQAQQPAAAPSAPAMAPAMAPAPGAPGAAMQPATSPIVAYARDRAECDALASASTTEGAAPSDADRLASIKKCLAGKGHSADEITKEEAMRSPAPAAPGAAMAPGAPAMAPAAPATH